MQAARWRTTVSAAALCLAAFLPATQAFSANLPKSDWTVGPINAASSSGVGFCSMKADFASGQGLVFARDAEGSNSLAVDFRRKLMETGGQYTVTLAVGALRREMSAIAATPSVLIIQMGLDHGFYTALQKKNTLQLDVSGSRLSFVLTGASEAFVSLNACAQAVAARKSYPETLVHVRGAQPGAPLAEVAAMDDPPPPPSPEQGGLLAQDAPGTLAGVRESVFIGEHAKPEEIDLGKQAVAASMQDEVEALQAENHRLLLENEAVASRMQNTDDGRIALLETENKELRDKLTGSRDAHHQAALEDQVQRLKDALAANQESQPSTALLTENRTLKSALIAAEAQVAAARADQRATALAVENERLRAQLAAKPAVAAQPAQQFAAQLQPAAASPEKPVQEKTAEAAAPEQKPAEVKPTTSGNKPVVAALPAPAQAAAKAEVPAAEEKPVMRVAQSEQPAAEEPKKAEAASKAEKPAKSEKQAAEKTAGLIAKADKTQEQDKDDAPQSLASDEKTAMPAEGHAAPAAGHPKEVHIAAAKDRFLPELLTRAHVRARGKGGEVSWKKDGIHGQAREEALDGQSASDLVEKYVEEASARCKGDFAHRVSSATKVREGSIIEGETACIDGRHDASAAVLFIVRDGKLDVISQEGPAKNMEKTLAGRQGIVAAMAK
jgi:hypothetical protein